MLHSLGFLRITATQHSKNTEQKMGLRGTILFFLLLSPDASHQPLISPAEVAVLESMMEGGRQLNLKAHFLTQLPDLCPLTTTLTYLNVSFNDLRVSRFIRYMAGYLMHDKLVYSEVWYPLPQHQDIYHQWGKRIMSTT